MVGHSMIILIWQRKVCSWFTAIRYLSFIYCLVSFNISYNTKSNNMQENMPWMSTKERVKALGILQADCSIREVRFWNTRCFYQGFNFLRSRCLPLINKNIFFFSMLDNYIITIRASVNCIRSSKWPEVLLTAIPNIRTEWQLFIRMVMYCFHS
jgi:hypothetical protein